MNIFLIIYSLVLLAVIFFGLRRIRQVMYWRNVLAENSLRTLQEISNELQKKK